MSSLLLLLLLFCVGVRFRDVFSLLCVFLLDEFTFEESIEVTPVKLRYVEGTLCTEARMLSMDK